MTRSAMSARTLSSHTGRVTCLSISADGHLLASGSDDGKVMLWRLDATTQEDQHNPIRTLDHRGKVTNVQFALPPPGLADPDRYRPSVCLAQALQKVQQVRKEDQSCSSSVMSTVINRETIEMDFGEEDSEEESSPTPAPASAVNGGNCETMNGASDEVKRLTKTNLRLYQMLKKNILSNASQ